MGLKIWQGTKIIFSAYLWWQNFEKIQILEFLKTA